jgi:DNA replication licensing factor MCM7
MISQGLIKAGEVATGQGLARMGIPPELERNYHLSIVPGGSSSKKTFVKMREIKASSVGSLVSVKGIVTRVSDVKPCMKVAVYACDTCGFEVYQCINGKQFTPKVECPS